MTFCMHTNNIDHVYVVSLACTESTMSTWRSIRGFKGEALKCDSDRLRLSTTLFLQQPTSNGDKVKTVKLPSYLKERLLDGYSSTVVRNLYTDKSLGPQLLADISTWFDCEKDPEIPSRPQECVPSRKYTDAHQGMQVLMAARLNACTS